MRAHFITRPHIACVILLMAMGAFIRIYGLGEWYYYHDEIWHTSNASRQTLEDVFYAIITENGHPPFYFFLLHALIRLYDYVWMPRVISLVSGISLIALGYSVSQKLFRNGNLSLFTSFILTFSAVFVEQSQVGRMYVLSMFLVLAALWNIASYANRPHLIYLLGYFITFWAAILTSYTVLSLSPILALLMLYYIIRISPRRRVDLALYAAIHCFILLCLLSFVYALTYVGGFYQENSYAFPFPVEPFSKKAGLVIIQFIPTFMLLSSGLSVLSGLYPEVAPLECILILSTILAGLYICIKTRGKRVIAGAFACYFILLNVLILFDKASLNFIRYNISYTLIAIPLMYEGFQFVYRKSIGRVTTPSVVISIMALGCICTLSYAFTSKPWRTDFQDFKVPLRQYEEIFNHLDKYAQPGDIILTEWTTYLYFWQRNQQNPIPLYHNLARYEGYKIPLYYQITDYRADPFVLDASDMQSIFRELESGGALQDVKRVWLITIDEIQGKNYTLIPMPDNAFRRYYSKQENNEFNDKITHLEEQHRQLIDELLASSIPQERYIWGLNCKPGQVTGCRPDIVLYPVPIENLRRIVLCAEEYDDPSAIVRIRMERKKRREQK